MSKQEQIETIVELIHESVPLNKQVGGKGYIKQTDFCRGYKHVMEGNATIGEFVDCYLLAIEKDIIYSQSQNLDISAQVCWNATCKYDNDE